MKMSQFQQMRALLIGGLIPVVTFAWVEDHYGTVWGLVIGMIFGLGEIFWEWGTRGRVDLMTWAGNGMLLVLGGVSLVTQQGVWFKLQPSLIESALVLGLWGSLLWKKPVLLSLAQKQGGLPHDLDQGLRPGLGPILRVAFQGLTFRLGVFFALHAAISGWAAFAWSTSAWVILKGVGLTVSLLFYLVVESLILRYRISSIQ